MTEERENLNEEEFIDQDSNEAESGGLYEHLSLKVDPGQEKIRIDKFLVNFRQNSSRNKIFGDLSKDCLDSMFCPVLRF